MARPSGLQWFGGVVAIGVAVTLAPACSTDSADRPDAAAVEGPAPASTTSAPSSTTSEPAASSCSTTAPAGRTLVTMTSGERERTYLRYVPPAGAFSPTAPAPLVIDLTAYSPAEMEEAFSSWSIPGPTGPNSPIKADVVGAVVVTPEPVNGSGLLTWNVDRTAGWADDVGFISDLLDDVSAAVCIDPDRVLVTGFAIGGVMASRLACDLADRITMIATVAGLWNPPDCAPARPVAVISFHGTDDHLLPFDGGVGDRVGALGLTPETSAGLGAMAVRPSAPDAAQAWATRNGCTAGPGIEVPVPGVERRSWSGCGAAVSLDVIDGGGHTWPGTTGMIAYAALLGPVSNAESATDVIWAFFEANSRSAGR